MEITTTPGSPPPVDTAALIADPYGTYAALRESGPVHRVTGHDGRPAWLVTRYSDVREALADPRLSLDKRNALPGNYAGFPLPPALDANLLNMDPPDHTRIRRLVVKAFTPGRVEKLREPIRQLCEELLDAIEPQGRADLIASYAGRVPVTVICDLLGVPKEDRHDFRAWTDALVAPDPAKPHLAKDAVGHMLRFYTGLIDSKRAEPADDLLSDLVTVQEEGEAGLSGDELTSLAFLILFAGYENVVHLIGNSVLALLERPHLMRELRDDPTAIPAAVEEFARFDGPAPLAIRRFPLEDVEIGGVTVPAGETVLLSIASANRDPAHFPDPDRLDPRRDRSGNLWLGHGIHYCLGASLGRTETEIALETLLRRLPGLALAVPHEELQWRPSMRARGLISLPVTW
ncbi:cytochrome P450 [Streptomyces sp. RB6PN25]|uniref:Cytochrome P450 n=1 Tax=Streptomyces humicola TaxID=2953240 RepID=A0ABT1PPQ2_9ACTN|nr:cytochrome P450 [Streptomyces humicola]MCQ4079654.1 cytochrome P450 [Streptomyces humicola]